MRKLTIPMLLTLFFSACTTIKTNPPPPPAERLLCDELPVKPELKPLVAFQTSIGVMVYHKTEVDTRDAKIAPYIVNLRGAWFSCKSQIDWNRDYYAKQ